MRNAMSWFWCAVLVGGCASGNGNDDGAGDSSASVGSEDSSGGSGSTNASDGMTSAPTSAATLTTSASTTDATDTDATTATTTDTTVGDSSSGGASLDCAEYCDVYMTSCVDHSEYANADDCMANCAQWPIGEATDTGVDSLGCRIYHATVAGSTDPAMHCPHAGPSGAATCVDAEAPTCELYCMRYFSNCDGELNAFADEAECMTECSAWYPGTEGDVDGHTIGCHSYHANAALGDPETHCPHAGPGGGGICVL